MLTVKYIDQTGHEQLIEATGVIWHPYFRRDPKTVSPDQCIENPAHMTIVLPRDAGEMELRGFGKIFVMNEAGKTVSSYIMSLPNDLPA